MRMSFTQDISETKRSPRKRDGSLMQTETQGLGNHRLNRVLGHTTQTILPLQRLKMDLITGSIE